MPKEYYLYVNGQKVKVSEQIYKVYWREREHEKYLEQVDEYSGRFYTACPAMETGDSGMMETAIPEIKNQ